MVKMKEVWKVQREKETRKENLKSCRKKKKDKQRNKRTQISVKNMKGMKFYPTCKLTN